MTGSWQNNGFWLSTPHQDFRFHIGGTVQYDLALYSASDRVQFGPGGTGDPGGILGHRTDGLGMQRHGDLLLTGTAL